MHIFPAEMECLLPELVIVSTSILVRYGLTYGLCARGLVTHPALPGPSVAATPSVLRERLGQRTRACF